MASRWASQRKLTFSAGKSQTFWFKGKLVKPLDIRLGGVRIKPTPSAKYLGVTFDSSHKFSTHLAVKAEGTKALFSRLHGVAKTKWGLKTGTPLRLYKTVFTPKMGYAASAWADYCMSLAIHRARANSAQILPLLAITGAYKMTTTQALQVLAGLSRLDLQLKELARIECDRIAVRRSALTANEASERKSQ